MEDKRPQTKDRYHLRQQFCHVQNYQSQLAVANFNNGCKLTVLQTVSAYGQPPQSFMAIKHLDKTSKTLMKPL